MPRKKTTEEPTVSNESTETEKKPRRKAVITGKAAEATAPKERKALFGRVKEAPKTAAVIVTSSGPEAPEPAPPEKPARKPAVRRSKKTEPVVQDDLGFEGGDDLPMPIWRARQERSPESSTQDASESGQPNLAPRRSRRPRSKASEQEAPTPTAERAPRRGRSARPAPEPEPTQIPAKPSKPLIDIPEDAPQIVLRDGVPTLVRNKRVYPPLFFFGSSMDERRAAIVMDEVRLASEAGVHLHSHLVDFEVSLGAVDSAVQLAGYLLSQSLKVDPEAQVLFRLVFVAPSGWPDTFPAAAYRTADKSLAEPSVCDDDFWGLARECLVLFVKKLRILAARDHVLGVHLERGEWFNASEAGYDTSTSAKQKFREWAKARYNNDDVALRAAWFSSTASCSTLEIPPYRPSRGQGADKFVRSERRERWWVDYHLFLSDATVQRIADLSYAVKEASEGYFLVGVSYGYTFEWSHPASGHLSLGKLLRTPEIDIIAGPPSYKSREPGSSASFPGPVDSIPLNGKLYISEEDFKTSIGQGFEPDDFNPTIKTPQALESVHWRGAGASLAHGSGMCWMDLWGNGWLKTKQIWTRGSQILQTLTNRMAAPIGDPDVALFVDERALAYLVDEQAFSLLVQNVREAVLRAGLSSGFFLLSDLAHRERFPESKLYIFLNAWDIRSDLRAAIKTRLQRDDKVLFWLYAAGMFDSGRESLERAREVTGIALKPQPFHSRAGTTLLNRRHPLCAALPEGGVVPPVQLEPTYFAIPEEAHVLGEYSHTGLPSFVVREFQSEADPATKWRSVFLGEPVITPALIRALGQMAGAHVWNFQDDVVHVRPPFLTVHCTGAGSRTVTLPNKWAAYDLAAESWATTDSTNLRFNATDGSTHVFLVGVKEEIESILSRNPADLLHMDQLPPKPVNTTRFDVDLFEVPMMKLGEFMEGASEDELDNETLLLPHHIIEDPEEEPERGGRRRRRRRRDRGGGEEGAAGHRENTASATFADEDLGMSVMFRKRD
ncbi:MAG: hypothetical protein WAO58_10260 [Fimbriimonadaceae bacterium]